MVRVPTIAEEDAKRPNRERECLVGERTRIVNRIKSTLVRLGIRNFKPTLRKAAKHLATVHTPEDMPLPPNILAELQRDMARLGVVVSQIREIEDARQKGLEQKPDTGPNAMVRLLARIVGVGVETADYQFLDWFKKPFPDQGMFELYRMLAERNPWRECLWVRLRAPPGIGAVQTFSGSAPQRWRGRHRRDVGGGCQVPDRCRLDHACRMEERRSRLTRV